jgi:hypothetical protein
MKMDEGELGSDESEEISIGDEWLLIMAKKLKLS